MQAEGGSGQSLHTQLEECSLTCSQAKVGKVSLEEDGGSVRTSILEFQEATTVTTVNLETKAFKQSSGPRAGWWEGLTLQISMYHLQRTWTQASSTGWTRMLPSAWVGGEKQETALT